MSLQSELQSRIARRQNAIKTLENAESRCEDFVWSMLQQMRAEQFLDKRLMRNIPWAEMYEIVGFEFRPL